MSGTGALMACKALRMPDWLPPEPDDQRRQVRERLDRLDQLIETDRDALARHRADTGLREAMASVGLLRWYLGVSLGHTRDGKACRVSGWTTATDPEILQRLLADAGIEATVVLGEIRAYRQPPVRLASSALGEPVPALHSTARHSRP